LLLVVVVVRRGVRNRNRRSDGRILSDKDDTRVLLLLSFERRETDGILFVNGRFRFVPSPEIIDIKKPGAENKMAGVWRPIGTGTVVIVCCASLLGANRIKQSFYAFRRTVPLVAIQNITLSRRAYIRDDKHARK